MKKLASTLGFLYLTFVLGCGSSQHATPAPAYSNASLKGPYVFTMSGQCVTGCSTRAVTEALGVLAADGNGSITAGSLDVNAGGLYGGSPSTISGSYHVNSDGTGSLSLMVGSEPVSGSILLTSPTGGYLMTTSGPWALSGQFEQQSAAASAPVGDFVFEASGLTSSADPWGMAGVMNFATNTVTADANEAGVLHYLQTAAIAETFDATLGRGTVAFSPAGSSPLPAMNMIYYVVDANTIELLSGDAFALRGRAEHSGGALTKGNVLSGSYAFLISGFPDIGVFASDGGTFTGDGGGNITSGNVDSVASTSSDLNESFTGLGTVSTIGNVTRDELNVTTNSTIAFTHPIAWFISPSRAAVIKMNTDGVETGFLNGQAGQRFADHSSFALQQSGWDLKVVPFQSLGNLTLLQNSEGSIKFSEQSDLLGIDSNTSGSGSLVFDASYSSGTIQMQNAYLGSESYRFYLYSPTDAFLMETDLLSAGSGVLRAQTAH